MFHAKYQPGSLQVREVGDRISVVAPPSLAEGISNAVKEAGLTPSEPVDVLRDEEEQVLLVEMTVEACSFDTLNRVAEQHLEGLGIAGGARGFSSAGWSWNTHNIHWPRGTSPARKGQ